MEPERHRTTWTLRRPRQDEIQAVFDLMIRFDMAEYSELDSDLEDLRFDWDQIELERDAWLAEGADGRLVGYATVLPWVHDLRLDIYLDPTHRESELGQTLLALCEARAREQVARSDLELRNYVTSTNRPARQRLEAAGFQASMYSSQMQIELAEEPLPAAWPPGTTLRAVEPGLDDQAIHQLVEESFARPGRTPTTLDQWRELMMRPEIFHPELWYLAEADGELVRVCLGFIYPDLGWVRQLAVRAAWRRRGLGGALLRHAFHHFRGRGLPRAGLTVDSVHPDAYAFYQRLGMEQIRQYIAYDKTLRAG